MLVYVSGSARYYLVLGLSASTGYDRAQDLYCDVCCTTIHSKNQHTLARVSVNGVMVRAYQPALRLLQLHDAFQAVPVRLYT